MNTVKYKLKAASEMLGVSPDRITYTLTNGVLPPRKRRYLHRWYSPEEILLLAEYFDVPIPKELENPEQ
jgi:DNA-binding transcriptional MerR regulator